MLDSLLLPFQPPEPVHGPVRLGLTFTWPWLASDSRRTRLASHGWIWHDRRPDCSNLAKTLEDRLMALRFIDDDAKVVYLSVEKFRGDVPGIGIVILSVEATP